MCQFTTLTHACGHTVLLTTSRRTLLCTTALNVNMIQGVDSAPASCFPKDADISNPAKVAAQNHDFGACDKCMANANYWHYSETDNRVVDDLNARIDDLAKTVTVAVNLFQVIEEFHEKVPFLKHKWLRGLLSHPGPDKLNDLLLQDLEEGRVWIPYLHACVEQNGTRDMFDATLSFVKMKMKAGQLKLSIFCQIMEALWDFDIDMEAGDPQRNIRSLGLRLQQAIDGISPASSPRTLRHPETVDMDIDLQDALDTIPGPTTSTRSEINPSDPVSWFSFSFSKLLVARRVRNPRGLSVKIVPLA